MKIQKFLAMMLVAFIGVFSSCQYDDEELWDSVNDLAGRVSALETLTKQMNSDISAMQSVISAWEKNVSVTSVETLTDGYILHFSDGTKAVIKNGKDGADGADGKDGKDGKDGVNAPVIDVAQENGVYYWTITVDGETTWLLDDAGNKLPVSGKDGADGADGEDGKDGADGEDGKDGADGEDGKDGENGKDGKNGITPILKIDSDGYWMVSYDNGTTYDYVLNSAGKKVNAVGPKGDKGETGDTGAMGPSGSTGSSGDSKFRSVVDNGDGTVTITLTTGVEFTFAKIASVQFKNGSTVLTSTQDIAINPDGTPLVLTYSFPKKLENASVEIVKNESVDVTVDEANNELTFKQISGETGGKVVILFYNDHQTLTSVLTFASTVSGNSIADLNDQLTDPNNESKDELTVSLTTPLAASTVNKIELPNADADKVRTITLSAIEVGAKLTIDEENTNGFDGTVIIELPENAPTLELTADVPEGTVIIKRGSVSTLYTTSGEYTTVVSEGATIKNIVVKKGHVLIEEGATVEAISRDNTNQDPITYVFYEGTVPTDKDTEVLKHRPAGFYHLLKAIERGYLDRDVDLKNVQWTPIGTSDSPFNKNFDGKGFTIKNLKIVETEAKEGKAYIGLFGYAENATIKNVTFENVNLNIPCLDIDHSQGHIGAVAGSLEGTSTIENVTVKGDIYVEATVTANGASRVAVVAGGNAYGDVTMKNVHVIANKGSYLKANNNVGALAGQLQGKNVFEDCSSNIDVTGTKFFAGGLIGLAAGNSTFTNCHTTGNVTITAGREGRHNDEYRVGGIAGGWADGKNNVCTLTNCSYTGKVSGKNSDGSVAEPLDYAGYVGRGYTLNGCAGSKVVIDGVEYIEVSGDANLINYVVVDKNVYNIGTASALKWLANEVNSGRNYFTGKTVKLNNDIDLNNAQWTPIGSVTKDHGFMGNFDGNNKTIKNLKITNIALDADGYVYAGLFGVTEGTEIEGAEIKHNYIKNLTIENVTITTEGDIVSAAIAYPYYTDVENITVKGDINITGGKYTAGILAYTRRCVNAKNLSIEGNNGSSVNGKVTVGGVISDIQTNGGLTANYSNFKASGLIVSGTVCVGGISGIISGQTLDGATVKNVSIKCEDARKGTVSGALGSKSIIKNISVNNVTGATNIIGATYDGALQVVVNGDEYDKANN